MWISGCSRAAGGAVIYGTLAASQVPEEGQAETETGTQANLRSLSWLHAIEAGRRQSHWCVLWDCNQQPSEEKAEGWCFSRGEARGRRAGQRERSASVEFAKNFQPQPWSASDCLRSFGGADVARIESTITNSVCSRWRTEIIRPDSAAGYASDQHIMTRDG